MKNILLYWKPLLTVSLWGASFIATKIVLDELNPVDLIFMRLFFGVLFLLALAIFYKLDLSLNKKHHGKIFILALVAVFHLWIQVTGMQYTSASNTGWIIGVSPVFMALLGFIFFKEKISLINVSGIFIAFTGLLLLISKGDFSNVDLLSNKGDFMILASAFTWSIYSAVNKKITLKYSPLLTTLFLFLMMMILLAPFTLSAGFFKSVFQLSLTGWISILFLGIFTSGIAYVLWAQSLKEMDSSKVGAFLYFEPFVTVFIAWLILNEEVSFLILISGIIITIGVILVNLKSKLKKS